jgi:hypothetical protein
MVRGELTKEVLVCQLLVRLMMMWCSDGVECGLFVMM